MRIRKVSGGQKCGSKGQVYKSRKGAEKQEVAAHAHGYREPKLGEEEGPIMPGGGYRKPDKPAAVTGPGKFSNRTDGQPTAAPVIDTQGQRFGDRQMLDRGSWRRSAISASRSSRCAAFRLRKRKESTDETHSHPKASEQGERPWLEELPLEPRDPDVVRAMPSIVPRAHLDMQIAADGC
jgi:hypothetical protein